jgi:tetrahydromethanopterin S-methyltransferase subunit G
MGFIEEGRQSIQDFVTPEIRSLEVRIDAVEKKIDSLEARIEKRFDAVDRRFDGIEKRLDGLDAKMERNQAQIMDTLHRMENYNQLAERVAKIESKLQNVA